MTTRYRILFNAFKLFDLLNIMVSFGLASWIVDPKRFSLTHILQLQIKVHYFFLLAVLVLVWFMILSFSGLYRSRRLSVKWHEIRDIFQATTLITVTLCPFVFINQNILYPVIVLVLFWLISSITLIACRVLLRRLLSIVRLRGGNLRYMLIVGTNPRAIRFARKIEARPDLGYRIVGFVDQPWAGLQKFVDTGYQLCCNFEQFREYLRKNVVDEVVIGLPFNSAYQQAAEIVLFCEEQGIIVRFLPSIFEMRLAHSRFDTFDDETIITMTTGKIEGEKILIKRIIDVVFSATLLIALLPLFAGVILLIKLTSNGPAFFVQKRLGLNKRIFHLYKFRSMVADADKMQTEIAHLNEVDGPAFKIKNDPRVTPVGKFLRRTSIDELPQLYNVLKGDMSLVGPRPLPVRDYEGFNQDWHRRRFSVRPGLTCLWQVNGRSLLSFQKWMELDMKYIDEWSLRLDFLILLKTIPVLFKGVGAV